MKLVPTKLVPTKVGADRKKVGVLIGLVVVLVVVFFVNRNSSPDGPVASSTPNRPLPSMTRTLPPELSPGPRTAPRGQASDRSSIADFRPTLKLKEGTDVSRIDPSLHLELLAKVKTVELTGGSRSLFEFAQPPAPPPPKVAPIVPGPPPPPPPKQVETAVVKPPPPPPPIPLKFYGYSGTARSAGVRSAFFLDGDDIVIARENDTIKNRYKIVRIGVNSAVVEDTVSKNQQTLPLIEELGS